jgi:hypothetical protein
MMTAMTSLASLAHTAAAPAFNGLFYATAATIIPVLFLAIAVQGRTYEDMLKTGVATYRRVRQDPQVRQSAFWSVTATYFASSPAITAVLILAAGAGAEICAVLALYQQHIGSHAGLYVLIGTIFLVIEIALWPADALLRSIIQAVRKDRTAHPLEPQGDAGQEDESPAPDATAPPEPGQTGT